MLIIDSLKKSAVDYKCKIKQFYRFIISLPRNIVIKIQQSYQYIIVLRTRLKNLAHINRDLGIYYLRKGDINEAIIRFRIGLWSLGKNNKNELSYWLALSYLIKGNYAYALKYINVSNNYDKIGLYQFLCNYKYLQEIPQKIWSTYKDITFEYYSKRFIVNNIDVLDAFVSSIFAIITEFPENYQILDYGCNDGIVGNVMCSKAIKTFTLTGVDIHKNIKTAVTNDNTKIYDQVISMPPEDFIKEKIQKFDMIIACTTVAYTNNITSLVSKLYQILKPGGYIALLLPYSDNMTVFDLQNFWFRYNADDIKELRSDEDKRLTLVQDKSIKSLDNNANIFKILLLQRNVDFVSENE